MNQKPVIISGPCVIESEAHALQMAKSIKSITDESGFDLLFKISFDKANRSHVDSYRGPGLNDKTIDLFKKIKERVGVKITTDIHWLGQVEKLHDVVDIFQIPAFLSKQTDLIIEAAESGKVVNVKKGQFMSIEDVIGLVSKLDSIPKSDFIITERGTMFGYNNLVIDYNTLIFLKEQNVNTCLDITHSIKHPATEFLGKPILHKHHFEIGMNLGMDYLFMEVHDEPKKAQSDSSFMLNISQFERLLKTANVFIRDSNNK